MAIEAGPLLLLLILGGIVAVDGTSVGQFMVSRPLVAATIAGWLVGDPVHGALIGLLLEAFQLWVLPVGAARYPEGGPAAVVGGSLYALSDLAASTLLLTVVFVLLLEWLGGESVRYMRQFNVRFASAERGEGTSAGELERRHLAAIGVDFLRGMVLVAAGLVMVTALLRITTPFWGLGEQMPQILLSAVLAGLLASTARLLGWRGWFLAAGGAGGFLLLLLGP